MYLLLSHVWLSTCVYEVIIVCPHMINIIYSHLQKFNATPSKILFCNLTSVLHHTLVSIASAYLKPYFPSFHYWFHLVFDKFCSFFCNWICLIMGKKPLLSTIQCGQIVILHKEGPSERKISEKLSIDSFQKSFFLRNPLCVKSQFDNAEWYGFFPIIRQIQLQKKEQNLSKTRWNQ